MVTLRRKDLVCQQAIELVTDYSEGTLFAQRSPSVQTHLRSCPNCSAYL